MSVTREFAQAVKEAARLSFLSAYLPKFEVRRSYWRRRGCLHQANGDLEHVVAQCEIGEAVPRAGRAGAQTVLCILEVLLCIFVKTGHRS